MAQPVETFRIKTEGHPHRCEVCHQDDRFDPLSGHCSRCTALIPILEPTVLPPLPEGDFGGLWLLGDILLMILSGGLGLIALGSFFIFGLLGLVRTDGPSFGEVFRMVGILLFSIPGFALFYWYVRIYLERVDVFQPRQIWFWTACYNALIVLILAGFSLRGEFFESGFLILAFWPAMVALYGFCSMRRYPLPEVPPTGESEE